MDKKLESELTQVQQLRARRIEKMLDEKGVLQDAQNKMYGNSDVSVADHVIRRIVTEERSQEMPKSDAEVYSISAALLAKHGIYLSNEGQARDAVPDRHETDTDAASLAERVAARRKAALEVTV